MNLSQRLRLVSLDKQRWQRLYYKNQQGYIRQRLSAIRYLSEGRSRAEVALLVGCTDMTLAKWIGKYLETGLTGLVEPIKHQVKSRLSPEQQQEIKRMLLNERPSKYGIAREIWTGKIIAAVIKQQWEVDLKTSRIYEILEHLNLSHQKAHRDYVNASPEKQKEFVAILKKKIALRKSGEKILFFDEFALSNRPTTYYGWAEKNSRPEVPSDESKKREKLNGLLAVDAMSGEEFLRLTPVAKTEDLVLYFGELCQECVRQKIERLTIILDNNPTHKNKLRRYLRAELFTAEIENQITVEFVYLPPYSPNFNLAEYLIHLLRLRLLHHLPIGTAIEQVKMRLKSFLETQQLQTPIQIENTIQHIYNLVL